MVTIKKFYVNDMSKARKFMQLEQETYFAVWHPELGILKNILVNFYFFKIVQKENNTFPK